MIGSLRHRAELLAPSRVADGGGGAQLVFASLGDVAAHITPRSGGQHKAAGFRRAASRHRVILRQHDDLSGDYRLRFDGREHRILDQQNEVPGPGFITLHVEEIIR